MFPPQTMFPLLLTLRHELLPNPLAASVLVQPAARGDGVLLLLSALALLVLVAVSSMMLRFVGRFGSGWREGPSL
jgi:hypothetical protein